MKIINIVLIVLASIAVLGMILTSNQAQFNIALESLIFIILFSVGFNSITRRKDKTKVQHEETKAE